MGEQEANRASLERIYPAETDTSNAFEKRVLDLHMERYRFAAQHIRGKRVLDMACGVGYGTSMLCNAYEGHAKFFGVDIDEQAIEYARKRFAHPAMEFQTSDAMRFESSERFATIVAIETIEHLPDPCGFVGRLLDLLSTNGLVIASVPTTPSVDANPYHLHDFTEASFRQLFEPRGFVLGPTLRQKQVFSPLPMISGKTNKRLVDARKSMVGYYIANPPALLRRISSTLRFGFCNRYVTAVWFRQA